MAEAFNYNAALRRLIELRFEAERKGTGPTREIRDLEQRIYRYLEGNKPIVIRDVNSVNRAGCGEPEN